MMCDLSLLIAGGNINPKQPDDIILQHISGKKNRIEENRPDYHCNYKLY